MKLYQLAEQYTDFMDLISNPEIEIDETTIKDTLEGLEGSIEDKIINTIKVIEGLASDAKAIKAAEERMSVRRKAMESNVSRLKEYVRINMDRCEISKVEDEEVSVRLQASTPALNVSDESLIPEMYFDLVPETLVLNKARLKEALKEHAVDGASLVRGNHIVIR